MTGEAIAREAARLLHDDARARGDEGRDWPKWRDKLAGHERRAAGRRRSYRKFWKDKSHMFRNRRIRCAAPMAAGLLSLAAQFAPAQERRASSRIDVEQYTIDAEISPNTQSLAAKATVRFVPLDDDVTSASFELNNALNVSRVVDDTGKQIPASRNQQDFTVRLSFDQPLPKGQPVTVTFFYDGKLTGKEDSPVYGIKFAAIHPDFAYLMYPARWFPVSGYTTDRFGADMQVTVPMGYTVLGSGIDTQQTAGDKKLYDIQVGEALVPRQHRGGEGPAGAKVQSEGVTTTVYFRGPEAEMAQPYGQEIGKIMSYFTGIYGMPPYANLTVVETEDGRAQRLRRARA